MSITGITNRVDVKPLTNEITDLERPMFLNKISELKLRGSDNAVSLNISDEAYKLSKSALTQVEMTTKLSGAVKANGEKGLNTGNYLEDLAYAYDQLHKTLNENSENSNKNGKYLDEAFRTLAKSEAALNGALIGKSITNVPLSIPLNDGVNPYVDSARKQAEIFSDSFLKDYNKNGINALKTAYEKLSNMPETTSLNGISYNDLKILADKNAQGMFNTKSGIEDVLKESGLSDFMRNYLNMLL